MTEKPNSKIKPLTSIELHNGLVNNSLEPDRVVVTFQKYAEPGKQYRSMPDMRKAINAVEELLTPSDISKLFVAQEQIISRRTLGYFHDSDELGFDIREIARRKNLIITGVQLGRVKKNS